MVNARATIDRLPMQSEALVVSSDDLLIEFFLRLPLTSVVRFKSVSKHWQSLLSHPPFTLLYKSVPVSLGFYVGRFYIPYDNEKRSSPPFQNLNFYPNHGIKIVQSCNGLLLCCSDYGDEYDRDECDRDESDRKYYVFNPSTKQFALIPSVPGAGDFDRSIYAMALAFHQTNCAHYKLVCIIKDKHGGWCQIQIYYSNKARWKNISDQSFYLKNYTKCLGVYWNQAIYWSCQFLCFNLDTEELQEMPIPLGVASYKFSGEYFGESGGYLHMAEGAESIDSHIHVNVYEMLNDHSGWFFKYRVELDDFLNAYPEMISRILELSDIQVLDVVRGEEEEDTFIVMQIAEKLIIRYNVADRSFKQISHPNLAYVYNLIGPREVHRYIATLASL